MWSLAGATEYLREGAADLLGVREEMTTLREQNYVGKALARRFEDVNWWDLLGGTSESEYTQTEQQRRRVIRRAWTYYFDHPVVRRTVDLVTFYTLGGGIPMGRYTDELDANTAEEEAGNDAIRRFWQHPENEAAITSFDAMVAKSLELQVQGQFFLNLHYASGPGVSALSTVTRTPGDDRPLPTGLKVTDLPEAEIVDVIRHPANNKIPLYYKRMYRPRVYSILENNGEGGWVIDTSVDPIIEYFPDWRFGHLDPGVWKGRPWGPPAELAALAAAGRVPLTVGGDPRVRMGAGKVMHVWVNKASDMRFGVSELQSYMKWAQGIDQYMVARMNTVLALAKLAMRAKTRGGAKSVSQTVNALQDMAKLSGVLEGTERMQRRPTELMGRTRAAVENAGVDLQPMVQDTNAGAARGDLDMMVSMVAAGSGIPGGHLGAGSAETLSAAVSKDGPMQKFMQARQKKVQETLRALQGEAVRVEGLDPAKVAQKMPPITELDVASMAAWLGGLLQTLDPNVANRKLMRWVFMRVLDAMGERDPKRVADDLLPDDQPTPFQQNLDATEIQQQAADELAAAAQAERAAQQQPTGGGGAGRPTNPVSTMRTAARSQDVEQNMLRPRGQRRPGGAAAFGSEARTRMRRRTGAPVEAALTEAGQSELDRLEHELRRVLSDTDERG